jgi:NAD(P)-dependent dehydrogenase (short-subunit alcohol dehydrogenase family)
MKDHTGQVVLITGGAKRTGLVLAREFAREGYDIALHYRASDSEARAAALAITSEWGRDAETFQADLNDDASLTRLIAAVYQRFGRLDVLINCASVFEQDHFKNFDLAAFDEAWRVNCRAPILLTRIFYDQAVDRRAQGMVINIVDQKVKGNFHADHFSYTVAKTALGNLTTMLAISCQPVLRVNAIFPGLLLPSDDQTEKDFEHARKMSTPLGYSATPEDVARAALEFVSPQYNGTDLVLDGGQNLVRVEQDVIYKYRSPEV